MSTAEIETKNLYGLSNQQVANQLTIDDVFDDNDFYSPEAVEGLLGISADRVRDAMNKRQRAGTDDHDRIYNSRTPGEHPAAQGVDIRSWIERMAIPCRFTERHGLLFRSRHPELDVAPKNLLDLADAARQEADQQQVEAAAHAAELERRRLQDDLAAILGRYDDPRPDDPTALSDLMQRLHLERPQLESYLRIIREHGDLTSILAQAREAEVAIVTAKVALDQLRVKYSKQLSEIDAARGAVREAEATHNGLQPDRQRARIEGLVHRAGFLFGDPDEHGVPTLKH